MKRRRQKGRLVNGILLVDKPAGITSNGALQKVKSLFGAAKVGHTGSLDPLATGILPLCFGEATKFSQFLLDADKRYHATFRLGVRTDTGDADGNAIATRPVDIGDRRAVDKVLDGFRGEIEQIPSMFSALKHKGEPLYKLARKGIEVERKPRLVTIRQLDLVELREEEFVVDIWCTKGTYIRSLADDIGERLGCGAHVSSLRRMGSGPYDVADSYTLDQLGGRRDEGGNEALDRCLLPSASAVAEWPRVNLTGTSAYYLRQGQAVQIAHAPTHGWVRIFKETEGTGQCDFLGVGEVLDDGRIAPRRLVTLGAGPL